MASRKLNLAGLREQPFLPAEEHKAGEHQPPARKPEKDSLFLPDKKRRLQTALQGLQLLILAVYLSWNMIQNSMLGAKMPDWFSNPLFCAASLTVFVLRMLFPENRSNLPLQLWVLAGTGAAALVTASFVTGYSFLREIAIMAIAATGIPVAWLVLEYCLCGLVVKGTTLLASMGGVYEELIYIRGMEVRHTFGDKYPTDAAAALFFLLIFLWAAGSWIARPAVVAEMLGAAALCLVFFSGRNSAICFVLAALVVCYFAFTERLRERDGRLPPFARAADASTAWLFAALAVIVIALSALYPVLPGFFSLLGRIPGSESYIERFRLASDAFQTYGFSLFGTAFDLVGAGGTAYNNGRAAGYNFVDASYCLIAVRYGIASLLALGAFYYVTCRRALAGGYRKLALAAALVAVHCIAEHHYTDIPYNPLLLLPFAAYPEAKKDPVEEGKAGRAVRWIRTVYLVAFAVGAALMLPRLLSVMRTVVTVQGLYRQEYRMTMLLSLGAIVLAAVGLVWAFWRLFLHLVLLREGEGERAALHRIVGRYGVVAVLCVACLGGSLAAAKGHLASCAKAYEEEARAGAAGIAALIEAQEEGDYRIYVKDIPEYYRSVYGSLAEDSFTTGNALIFTPDTVLITRRMDDIHRLFEGGYTYGVLSDWESVYTNSPAAAEALQKAGIELTPWFSAKRRLDLDWMARTYEIPQEEDGALYLDGNYEDTQYRMGPQRIELYRGLLEIEYDLRLVDGPLTGELGVLRVCTEDGDRVWAEFPLYREDFSEESTATLVRQVAITEDTGSLTFQVIPYQGVGLSVVGIIFGKVGPA